MKILFVCTGNTCRSPMAEGIAKQLLPEHSIRSAGLATVDGLPASPHAIEACRELAVDLTAHRSKMITNQLLEEADLILCMTQSHKTALATPKAHTLTEFVGASGDIVDPYGGDLEVYRACASQLKVLITQLAERLHD